MTAQAFELLALGTLYSKLDGFKAAGLVARSRIPGIEAAKNAYDCPSSTTGALARAAT